MEIHASAPVNIEQMPHRSAPEYRRVYANNATMAMTFWDFTMTFGETVFDNFGDAPHIEDRVSVSMSWEHTKALYQALEKVIEGYEATQGGKIRISPGTSTPIVPQS
jgi:hypothetical protein